MREIKVRAWHKINNYMIDDFLSWCLNNFKLGYNPWNDENYIKEQYTGLKDISKTESYENDIILTEDGLFIIKWEFTGWYCFTLDFSDYFSLEKYVNKFETIGNVHDNTELLEASK